MIGKLCGELINRTEVRNVSLLISPDYHRLRACLTEALAPFPQAARAVAIALGKMESEALATPAPASPAPPSPKLIEHAPVPPKSPPVPMPALRTIADARLRMVPPPPPPRKPPC